MKLNGIKWYGKHQNRLTGMNSVGLTRVRQPIECVSMLVKRFEMFKSAI